MAETVKSGRRISLRKLSMTLGQPHDSAFWICHSGPAMFAVIRHHKLLPHFRGNQMKINRLSVFGLCAAVSLLASAQSIDPPKEILVNTADLEARNPFDGIQSKSVYTYTTALFFITIEAGSSSAHHNHAEEQTMLFHSGRVRAIVDDREYEVVEGDVLVIPAWVPHQMVAIEDSSWTEVHGPGINNSRAWEMAGN